MLDLQKASFGKRISAYLFDVILLFIAVIGIGCIFSAIVGYDSELQKYTDMNQSYVDKYGIDLARSEELCSKYTNFITEKEDGTIIIEITDEERANLTAADQVEIDELTVLVNLINQANADIENDEEIVNQFSKIVTLTILTVTISTLLSYLVLEFAVPIFIGNGQTIGKKVFGVALMRTDGVKITTMQLFVRTILGKFTLETMIPLAIIGMMMIDIIGITGPIVLLGIIVMEAVCYVKSNNGSFIHDIVAVTVCVDYSSQMIFESEDALIAYKEQIANEAINSMKHTAEPLSSIYQRKDEQPSSDDVEITPPESYSSIVMDDSMPLPDALVPEFAEHDSDLSIDLPDAELVSNTEELNATSENVAAESANENSDADPVGESEDPAEETEKNEE